MPAVFADEDISLLADTGVAVCPYCGSACKVHDRGETLFTVTLLYECENYLDGQGTCSYYRLVTRVKGLGIEYDSKGSGINPSIVDGNAYWQVPADEIETNPYYSTETPSQPLITKDGYPIYYLPLKDPGELVSAGTYELSPNRDYYTYSFLAASSSQKFSFNWTFPFTYGSSGNAYRSDDFVIPVSGTYRMYFECQVLAGMCTIGSNTYKVGDIYTVIGSKDTQLAGNTISGWQMGIMYGYNVQNPSGGYYGVRLKVRYAAILVSDEYDVPFDYNVTNNNYINVENKTITVNNQEINYNNAYFQNNAYYIYQADGGVSTYITDASGKIIGACIYQADTNSYQIVLFGNYTEDDLPDDSGSSGDNNGGSGGSGGSSGGSDDSDSGGGWLSNLFQDLLKKLFEGIVDGLLAVLKAALGIILKLLTSLFLLIPLFSKALSYVFPFIPLSVLSVMTAGFALLLILAIVKFIRGFF